MRVCTGMHINLGVCMHDMMYVYMCLCTYVYVYVCVWMHVYLCMIVCACAVAQAVLKTGTKDFILSGRDFQRYLCVMYAYLSLLLYIYIYISL